MIQNMTLRRTGVFSESFVVIETGVDVRAGILRGVLDVKAGLLELGLLGKGMVPVIIGIHPGQVEGVHGVLILLELDGVAVLIQHLDVQAQGLQFLDQNLEGLGHAGLGYVVALDDGLVGAGHGPSRRRT